MERRALAALAVLFLLPGCTQPGSSAQPELEAKPRAKPVSLFHAPENLEQLTVKLREASYLIECGESSGSGFGYTMNFSGEKQDFIVTTKAAVSECLGAKSEAVIRTTEGSTFSAEVLVATDPESYESSENQEQEVAVLNPRGKINTLSTRASSYLLGTWVITGAFPTLSAEHFTWTITHGQVASNLQNFAYALTTPNLSGSAGGAVLNSRGEVLGVVLEPEVQNLQGLSRMLSILQAEELMNKLKLEMPDLEAEPRLG